MRMMGGGDRWISCIKLDSHSILLSRIIFLEQLRDKTKEALLPESLLRY